ncbi:uncharacterized protein LOC120702259 [Panicum virgatum]|uniref:uncharacterized protein LOC120702259 n=1 Tax=Panicum virgatum TaxID=38727 RepID=UPI0019D66052|nr:uncharacterized protein LOC120702259 [Panicum virgatum]
MQFATYTANTPPRNGYSGGMATMDVYSFPNRRSGDRIATVMWISNDDINIIEAGWLVEPSRYGDSKSHFFVAWTAGGFGGKPAGCFDLDCNGFVPVNGAPITPGDTLELVNGQAKISFKIFKNRDDGDWWLHFGQDVNNLHPVGFWPKSLFNKMENHANIITWGGHTRCDGVNPSPPMGNGQWPGKNSASIQNIQFVDTDGRGYAVPAWALKVDSGNKKCYQASPFINSMFYYGGPGGCTN